MTDKKQAIAQVDDPDAQLSAIFSQTANTLLAAGSVDATMQQIVDLAVATIEGCDYAGIFLIDEGTATTAALTDPIVAAIDALERAAAEGPSLDAMGEGTTFYADDLTEDDRWSNFGPQAAAAGVRSVLAMPLPAKDAVATLNLYARYPRAFGVIDRAKGQVLTALAGLALTGPDVHEEEARRRNDMRWALATREVIGTAQGILMERERITSDQAFEILQLASQHLNIKVRQVAQNLVDTGENPQTGPSAPSGVTVVPAGSASPDQW